MKEFSFGQRSTEVLQTLASDLQMFLIWGLRYSRVDFGLNEGYRSPEKQFEYYKKGRKQKPDGTWVKIGDTVTNVDGYAIKGNHNFNPSRAVDIYIYVPGHPNLAYNLPHLSYVAGIITAASEFLFEQGKVQHKARWGANWDGDREILYDQSFDDAPHIEIYKP